MAVAIFDHLFITLQFHPILDLLTCGWGLSHCSFETDSMKTRKLVGAYFVKQLIIITSLHVHKNQTGSLTLFQGKPWLETSDKKVKENSENLQNMGVEASPVTTHS